MSEPNLDDLRTLEIRLAKLDSQRRKTKKEELQAEVLSAIRELESQGRRGLTVKDIEKQILRNRVEKALKEMVESGELRQLPDGTYIAIPRGSRETTSRDHKEESKT